MAAYRETYDPSLGKGVPTGPLGKSAVPRNYPCRFVQVKPERCVNVSLGVARHRHKAISLRSRLRLPGEAR